MMMYTKMITHIQNLKRVCNLSIFSAENDISTIFDNPGFRLFLLVVQGANKIKIFLWWD